MKKLFAAHIDNNGNVQTVTEHNLNTAELAAYEGEKCHLKNAAYLAGLLHDVGKATDAFNRYIRGESNAMRGSIDHSTAGGKYIAEAFADTNDCFEKVTSELISVAIFSHHGLMDLIDPKYKNCFDERLGKQNICYDEAVENEISRHSDSIKTYFNRAVQEIKGLIDGKEPLNIYVVERMLLSLLIAADRKDTIQAMGGTIFENELDRADLWRDFSTKLEGELASFDTEIPINAQRAAVSKKCLDFAAKPTSIYTLQLPTGAGKTLASLRFAINHAAIYKKERIFYVAPFKTILEQNAAVIRDVLQNYDAVLEHHSDVIIEDDTNESKRLEQYGYLTDTWDSPVILTSFVQMMNTWFGHKTTSIRRLQRVSNSVIIFDEIQFMPVNMVYLFNSMANVLAEKFNVTIVLCSATQPVLDTVDHPINITESMVDNVSSVFKSFKRNTVIDLSEEVFEPLDVANLAADKLKTQSSGLIVVNTKKQAVDIYKSAVDICSDTEIFYLTTNMCPQHRMDILDKIRAMLDNGDRVLCVSTNLIEAGVDISFDFAIRAMAGLDSIVQTAGRCNRSGNALQLGEVYMVRFSENLSSGLKYIQAGKSATEQFLNYYNKDEAKFDNDIISPASLESYYLRYYTANKSEMAFNADKYKSTVWNMLTDNGDFYYDDDSHILHQAFKTAASEFSVISDGTVGVIVPYGEGKEIIAELVGDKDVKEIKSLLKKAQRYTVNLYQNKINELEQAGLIVCLGDTGIYILKDNAYDSRLGVTEEAKTEACIL